MMANNIRFTTPVARMVGGSCDKPRTTDFDGKPLLIKTGAKTGQPTQQFFIAIAIPKQGEAHWAYTDWGKQIWDMGHRAFPQQAQTESFAWKITDGDSAKPNKKGKLPKDQTGYPGHWVLKCGSTFAPKTFNADGTAAYPPEAIKPGYYVQVFIDAQGNGQPNNAGVFLNPLMVSFQAYGEEISQGVDPAEAGFGGKALPAGASVTPPANFTPPASPLPAAAGMTPPPPAGAPGAGSPPPPGAASVPPPATTAPAANPSSAAPPPNPAFTSVAPPPAATVAAPAPPAAPVRQMTPAAQGVSYDAYIAKGWTDDLLRQHGYMV